MFIPFPYQVECLDTLQEVYDRGGDRALMVMASGLGKTVTMAFDAKRWREGHGGRVLFLCHNNDILYQAKTTFEAVNGPAYSYGYFHGEEKHLHNVDFLFASLQTMERYTDYFDPSEFAYVVVDESHHSQANTFRATIEHFRPRFLLGATATPDRLDELNIREIFGSEVYSLPLEEAMVRGLVTPVDYRLQTDEIQIERALKAGEKKISLTELNRRIFVPRRDEEIAKIIARHASEFGDPRVMIFCTSIKHCEHLAQYVPNSFAIHSRISEKERAVKLELFRQGIIGTVLTVNAFNEGIDIPQANVIVFLRATTSRAIFLQQLGRGLRRSKGKDKVIVLDFVVNCERVKIVHALWRDIEEALPRYPAERESAGASQSPMMLNVDSVEFTETVIPLLKLMERLRQGYTKEVLAQQLRDLASALGRTPMQEDANEASAKGKCASVGTFQSVFGSWNAALKAAGLKIVRNRGYQKGELLSQLQSLASELGRTPTAKDVDAAAKQGKCASTGTLMRVLGSFNRALKAANLRVNRRYDLGKEQMLQQLRALGEELDRTPSVADIDVASKARKCPSLPTLRKKFGSRSAALKAAGFVAVTKASKHYTLPEVAEQLQRLAKKLGRRPVTNDVNIASKAEECASMPAIVRAFGSLDTALKQVNVR